MNKNHQDPTAHTSARRRLVRGAFAAPVALTLYSGGVAAASINCIAKEVASPTYPTQLESGPYLRVQLYTLPGTPNMSAWIKGDAVTMLAAPNSPIPQSYISSTQWQCFSAGDTATVKVGMTDFTPPVAGTLYAGQPLVGMQAPTLNGSFVALRVNASGQIVGVVGLGSDAGNSAIHTSCWASFKPTP